MAEEKTRQDLETELAGKPIAEQVAEAEKMLASPPAEPVKDEPKEEKTNSLETKSDAEKETSKPVDEGTKQAVPGEKPAGDAKPEDKPVPTTEERLKALEGENAKLQKRLDDNRAYEARVANENAKMKKFLAEIEKERAVAKTEESKHPLLKDIPDLEEAIDSKLKNLKAAPTAESTSTSNAPDDAPDEVKNFQKAVLSVHSDMPSLLNDKDFQEWQTKFFADASQEAIVTHPEIAIQGITQYKIDRAAKEARLNAEREFSERQRKEKELSSMSTPGGGKGSKPSASKGDLDMDKLKNMSLAEIRDFASRVASG